MKTGFDDLCKRQINAFSNPSESEATTKFYDLRTMCLRYTEEDTTGFWTKERKGLKFGERKPGWELAIEEHEHRINELIEWKVCSRQAPVFQVRSMACEVVTSLPAQSFKCLCGLCVFNLAFS